MDRHRQPRPDGLRHPEHLVDTAWLAEHLAEPGVRVIEVTGMLTRDLDNRARSECFDAGHIPGSLFLDIASPFGELSDPDAALPWTWPSAEQVAATMGRYGISNSTRV